MRIQKVLISLYARCTGFVGTTNVDGRERWLKKALSEISAGKRILDAGAGEMQYKKFCGHLAYTSQDFAQYKGHGDERGLQKQSYDATGVDIVSDITDIPVEDNSFDVILCVEVLEHLPYPEKAIQEFMRILKPGGLLILTAPFISLTHYAPYHFATGFNRYWYEEVLTKYGFQIEELVFNGNYFQVLAQEIRRIIPVAHKYSGRNICMDLGIAFFSLPLLVLLFLLNQGGGKSEELLAYGIHIKAIKE